MLIKILKVKKVYFILPLTLVLAMCSATSDAKPVKRDGVCETIIIEDGEIKEIHKYLCS